MKLRGLLLSGLLTVGLGGVFTSGASARDFRDARNGYHAEADRAPLRVDFDRSVRDEVGDRDDYVRAHEVIPMRDRIEFHDAGRADHHDFDRGDAHVRMDRDRR
jgi:hypothetical protein